MNLTAQDLGFPEGVELTKVNFPCPSCGKMTVEFAIEELDMEEIIPCLVSDRLMSIASENLKIAKTVFPAHGIQLIRQVSSEDCTNGRKHYYWTWRLITEKA